MLGVGCRSRRRRSTGRRQPLGRAVHQPVDHPVQEPPDHSAEQDRHRIASGLAISQLVACASQSFPVDCCRPSRHHCLDDRPGRRGVQKTHGGQDVRGRDRTVYQTGFATLARDDHRPQNPPYDGPRGSLALGPPPSLVTSLTSTAFADAPDAVGGQPRRVAAARAAGPRGDPRRPVRADHACWSTCRRCRAARATSPARLARRADWFGGPRGRHRRRRVGAARGREPGRHRPSEEAPVATGDAFSAAQRHEIDKAIRDAETLCRFEFSVYVGRSEGETRPFAERLHAALVGPGPLGAGARRPGGQAARGRHRRGGAPRRSATPRSSWPRSPCRARSRPATWSAASPAACSSSPSTPAARSCTAQPSTPRRAAPSSRPCVVRPVRRRAPARRAPARGRRAPRGRSASPPGSPATSPATASTRSRVSWLVERPREHVLQHRRRDLGAPLLPDGLGRRRGSARGTASSTSSCSETSKT